MLILRQGGAQARSLGCCRRRSPEPADDWYDSCPTKLQSSLI
jgi:hypothetical protein